MKLTLHIGMGKAGSTSIQDSLYAARNEIREYGCLFPDTLYIPARHHWLQPLILDDPMRAPSVMHRMGFSSELAKKGALEEWDYLLRQLDAGKPDNLILSSEVLFATHSPEEIARAREFLPKLSEDISVFAYVRSPVKRYLSSVQQALKSKNRIVQPGGAHVSTILKNYSDIYGDVVNARVFEKERLRNHDVIADFLEWADLPIPYETLPKMQSNESVSAEGMAILQEMSPETGPSNPDELTLKRKRFRAVLKADQAIAAPTKPELRPEIAEYIVARSKELPILRDEYGLYFDDIDYSLINDKSVEKLEITRIDEICSYDAERKEMVQNKAEKILARVIERDKRKVEKQQTASKPKGMMQRMKEIFTGG